MAYVNLYARYLDILRNDTTTLVTGTSTAAGIAATYNTQLTSLIAQLQQNQFAVIQSRIAMNNRIGNSNLDSQTYNTYFLLQNNATQVYPQIFNDALFQYITYASSIVNSSIFSTAATDIQSSNANFFFVITNGLQDLRFGSELIGGQFYNYYMSVADSQTTTFLIFMVVGIAFMVLSMFVLIPIVFNVHRTNNKVLALFGYIPKNEIENLVNKCEKYMEKYLEDHNGDPKEGEPKGGESPNKEGEPLKNDVSYQENAGFEESNDPENVKGSLLSESGVVDKQVKEMNTNGVANDRAGLLKNGSDVKGQTIPAKKGDGQTPRASDTLALPGVIQVPSMVKNNSNAGSQLVLSGPIPSQTQQPPNAKEAVKGQSGTGVTKPGEKKPSAETTQKEKDAEAEDEESERTKKLLNSKDNNRTIIILQFTTLTAIFVVYFALNYYLETTIISNVEQGYSTLYLLAATPSIAKYVVVFTVDEIARGSTLTYGGMIFPS